MGLRPASQANRGHRTCMLAAASARQADCWADRHRCLLQAKQRVMFARAHSRGRIPLLLPSASVRIAQINEPSSSRVGARSSLSVVTATMACPATRCRM